MKGKYSAYNEPMRAKTIYVAFFLNTKAVFLGKNDEGQIFGIINLILRIERVVLCRT